MLPEQIFLRDKNPWLVAAWGEAFSPFETVDVAEADFFSSQADALVSPANSFGIMDGGLDAAISARLIGIQRIVQDVILERHHGEIPVGAAEVVETGHSRWPYLICAPTMRVPENISNTVNAYLAFRAALLAAQAFNRSAGEARIRSLVVPGLGTGVGRLEPRRCAGQMRIAYDAVITPAHIPGFQRIHSTHIRLRSIT
ncbi:MAG: macro domain-containing protein [Myxococcota bacterium]|nr:macro domain-containing protein [Myxococcota bacterium]